MLLFPKAGSGYSVATAQAEVVRARDGRWRVDYWMITKFHGPGATAPADPASALGEGPPNVHKLPGNGSRKALGTTVRRSIFNDQVTPFDVAEIAQPFAQRAEIDGVLGGRYRFEDTEPIDPLELLRTNVEQRRENAQRNTSDESTAIHHLFSPATNVRRYYAYGWRHCGSRARATLT